MGAVPFLTLMPLAIPQNSAPSCFGDVPFSFSIYIMLSILVFGAVPVVALVQDCPRSRINLWALEKNLHSPEE